MEVDKKNTEQYWYVLRDLKRPNAKNPAYKVLQEEKYHLKEKIFIPMRQCVFTRSKKTVVSYVPFMSDLLFVHETRELLDPIIRDIGTLQYRYAKGCKQNDPMKVPDDEMSRFIEAVRRSEKVEYFRPDEVSPNLYGKKICIIGGALDGFKGRLMSKRGSKSKRLIIDLEGYLSAAIDVEPEYIRLL